MSDLVEITNLIDGEWKHRCERLMVNLNMQCIRYSKAWNPSWREKHPSHLRVLNSTTDLVHNVLTT